MTTGPRPTPHPIILHVDDAGNPVRLAEASSIYVTTVSAVSISATNYLGLGQGGRPEGMEGSIQFKQNNGFAGQEGFTYDDNTFTLNLININSTNTITANNLISTSTSSTNLSAVNIRSNSISATTVCATNYDTLLDALSFQNLDSRYLNSSGDSVTGSFSVQSLSSTSISATNYLNIPSTSAIWNASSIQGIPVTSTPPTPLQTLIYNNGVWQPSSVAGVAGGVPGGNTLTIQFNNGTFSGVDSIKYNSSISGIESIGVSSTNLRSITLSANVVCATVVSATSYLNLGENTAQWNANKIYGTPFNKGSLLTGDFITYDGVTSWANTRKENAAELVSPQLHTETWNASGIRGVQVTSTAPTNNNVLIYNGSVWTPSSAISLATIAATNLGGTDIVGTRANITNVSATTLSSTSLSSVSARITGLSATTISATNWQGLPLTNASSFGGLSSNFNSPTAYDLVIINYSADNITNISIANAAPVIAANLTNGSTGSIQFKGPTGSFSGDTNLSYNPSEGRITTSAITLPSGSIFLPAQTNPTYISNQGLQARYITVFDSLISPFLSATSYNIFGKNTSTTDLVTRQNQSIVYASGVGYEVWKPGYAVYQATGTPPAGTGENGDIWFQYLP